jgi:hypothetical protein
MFETDATHTPRNSRAGAGGRSADGRYAAGEIIIAFSHSARLNQALIRGSTRGIEHEQSRVGEGIVPVSFRAFVVGK